MNATGRHYDDLETRDPAAREADLMAALPEQVALAKAKAPGFAKRLAEIEPAEIDSRAALARLPVLRKTELIELQREAPPFGGLTPIAANAAQHLYASPGPIHELETVRRDYWRLARALFAAGFRAGDILHNCFGYHLTPGGWMLDDGARALGCAVIPAGVGNSEQQVATIAHYRPNGYSGTPDFLKVLLDAAAEQGADCSSIVKALVSGGALFPSLRTEYKDRGVEVLQCYATADIGLIAYESDAQEGMIVDENIILEIVRPGTDDPLPEGEVGEVVVTPLNPDYPLIRFGTGDLSALLPGISPCGRTNMRIKGWMGRADQTTKVKGMFVHPGQVAAVLRRHPEIARGRLVVTRQGEQDAMVLECEVEGADGKAALQQAIEESIQACCKLRGGARLVPPGSLPNDGKVIDDQRRYD